MERHIRPETALPKDGWEGGCSEGQFPAPQGTSGQPAHHEEMWCQVRGKAVALQLWALRSGQDDFC